MGIKEKVTFYITMTLLIIGTLINSRLLWEGSEKIDSLSISLEKEIPNLEIFGNEIEQLIANKRLNSPSLQESRVEFLEVPYCSPLSDGVMTVISFQRNLSAHIWDIKGGGHMEYLKKSPDFKAQLYYGVGGVSIQFTGEDSTYFPTNFSFTKSGKVLSFFIASALYSPCIPLGNQ